MLLNILSVVLVVAFLYSIICIPVGMFNTKLFMAIHGTKCTGLNRVKAYLPFYNITFSRWLAYGGSMVFSILLLVCALLLVFRFVAIALVASVPILVVYSALTTLGCIALYTLLYIINAVDFCRMFSCGAATMLCCLLIAPVGYYMLSLQVLSYFRNVEDEVSGRFGDQN